MKRAMRSAAARHRPSRFRRRRTVGHASIAAVLSLVLVSHVSAQSYFTNKDAWYGELGGKGFVYALMYEHLVKDDYGVNLGLTVIPRSLDFPTDENPTVGHTSDSSTVIIPAFVSWYPAGVRNRLYIDAGLDLLVLSRQRKLTAGALAAFAFGYNYRPRADGYYFKVGPVLLCGAGGERSLHIRILPWFGIAAGTTF